MDAPTPWLRRDNAIHSRFKASGMKNWAWIWSQVLARTAWYLISWALTQNTIVGWVNLITGLFYSAFLFIMYLCILLFLSLEIKLITSSHLHSIPLLSCPKLCQMLRYLALPLKVLLQSSHTGVGGQHRLWILESYSPGFDFQLYCMLVCKE